MIVVCNINIISKDITYIIFIEKYSHLAEKKRNEIIDKKYGSVKVVQPFSKAKAPYLAKSKFAEMTHL